MPLLLLLLVISLWKDWTHQSTVLVVAEGTTAAAPEAAAANTSPNHPGRVLPKEPGGGIHDVHIKAWEWLHFAN